LNLNLQKYDTPQDLTGSSKKKSTKTGSKNGVLPPINGSSGPSAGQRDSIKSYDSESTIETHSVSPSVKSKPESGLVTSGPHTDLNIGITTHVVREKSGFSEGGMSPIAREESNISQISMASMNKTPRGGDLKPSSASNKAAAGMKRGSMMSKSSAAGGVKRESVDSLGRSVTFGTAGSGTYNTNNHTERPRVFSMDAAKVHLFFRDT
jgi:hypothetical protein